MRVSPSACPCWRSSSSCSRRWRWSAAERAGIGAGPTAILHRRFHVLPAGLPRWLWRLWRGWGVDYPRADQNLSIDYPSLRSRRQTGCGWHANYFVIQASEPERSSARLSRSRTTERDLRRPISGVARDLQKGGFLCRRCVWELWRDHWLQELRKYCRHQYPLVDLPINHSIFRTLYEAKRIPQIRISAFSWHRGHRSVAGQRGSACLRILDPINRIVVLTTQN